MRRTLSVALVLVMALASSACQLPTQVLPPAPVFDMKEARNAGGANGTASNVGEEVSDTLGVVDNGGISPGSVEDFLRYAGSDKVYFAYDSAELTAEGRTILGRQAEWLAKYPQVSVSLEGHADERGTREYNFALGERRAAAMKFYLIVRGLAATRLKTTSFGKERPVVAGSDEQSWAQNRRGETVLIGAVGQK